VISFRQFITEGLDLSVSGHLGDLWTRDILGVTSTLARILNPEFGVMHDDITPDNNNFDQRQGNINIYKANTQDDEDHKHTAIAAQQWLAGHGFKIASPRLDRSGFREGEPVWRINIAEMPPDNNEPNVHFTYSNAAKIFKFLGYTAGDMPDPEHFTISAHDLLDRIERFGSNINRMKQHERPNEREGNFYSMGLDYTDIQRRIGQMKVLAQWAIDHGYEDINGS